MEPDSDRCVARARRPRRIRCRGIRARLPAGRGRGTFRHRRRVARIPLLAGLFGALAWSGVALPLVGLLALRLRGFGETALALAVEWLVTCVVTGLSCAMAWQRYT